jgi:hypothetical protein
MPYVESFQPTIPKAHIFIFENRWLDMDGFFPLVEKSWSHSIHYADAAKRITSNLKIREKKEMKKW